MADATANSLTFNAMSLRRLSNTSFSLMPLSCLSPEDVRFPVFMPVSDGSELGKRPNTRKRRRRSQCEDCRPPNRINVIELLAKVPSPPRGAWTQFTYLAGAICYPVFASGKKSSQDDLSLSAINAVAKNQRPKPFAGLLLFPAFGPSALGCRVGSNPSSESLVIACDFLIQQSQAITFTRPRQLWGLHRYKTMENVVCQANLINYY